MLKKHENASKNAMDAMESCDLLVFVIQENTLIDLSGAGMIVMIGLGFRKEVFCFAELH